VLEVFEAKGLKSWLMLAGAVVTLGFSGVSRGDVGLALPPVTDDAVRGVRGNGFIFVPFVSIEGRYNSNIFRQDSREASLPWTAILSVVPGFKLENPDFSWVKLTWDAQARIHQYFSDNEQAKRQGRIGVDTSLRADFFPRSVVGFFIADKFIREMVPPNYPTSGTRYDRNVNHAEAGIQIRPGGNALEFALSYAFNFYLYDSLTDFNRFYHEARLLTTWDLLPKTTLFLDADWRYTDWRKQLVGLRVNSMPLRVSLGLKGFVTKKIGIRVQAGFGKGFYDSGPDYMNFIGEASIGFKPTPFTLIDLGYDRDFYDAYYANYYVADSAHLKFGQQFARRVNLTIQGKYSYIGYASYTPDPTTYAGITPNQASRRGHGVTATVDLAWSAIRYISLNVGYTFRAMFTDFRIDYPDATVPGGVGHDYGGYMAHEVYLRLSLMY